MTIIDAIRDSALFRPLFKDLDTWRNWEMALKAMDALPMTEDELVAFRQLTHRHNPPTTPAREVWFVKGRRGGGSWTIAVKGSYLACFKDYKPYLAPGERAVIVIVATDRKQSRVIMRYINAILNSVPMLAALIERQDVESIDLSNGVTIEIMTASFRTIRGYTIVAALCDEMAFWRSEESANPAAEVLAALRPAMATVPGSVLLCIGSPYKRSGPLYEAWRRHFGQEDSPVLVFQASTRTMNPTVPEWVIDEAFERDPINASAEYMAEFRSDVGSFLDLDSIERAIESGRQERPPQVGIQYVAFADPSGGSRDSFSLAIAHKATYRPPRNRQEDEDQQRQPPRVVLDLCRAVQPPFSPDAVVKEFCDVLKSYRCWSVTGDRYSMSWVVEAFARHGIVYKHSELTKSELYLECLPLFMTGCVEMLDIKRLTMELLGLERRTGRSGKDSVDHGPSANSHDDMANSCCGALSLCTQRTATVRMVHLTGW